MAAESSVICLVGDEDAVGDVEIGFLAHGLELGDHLALVAFGDKLRGEVAVEHHGQVAVDLGGKARLLHGFGQDVVLFELDFRSFDVIGHGLAAVESVHHMVAVGFFERRADFAQQLSVLGTEGAHLRFQVVGGKSAGVVGEIRPLSR